MDLNCFKIDEEAGCAIHYMAARHHGQALSLYLDETGGTDSVVFTVTLIPDDKVPGFKVLESDDGNGDLFLIECLARARATGVAQMLCTSEF